MTSTAMLTDVQLKTVQVPWRQWLWQRKLPLLWLLAALLALGLALLFVAWQALHRAGLSYNQMVLASDMIVTSSYIAAAGNNRLPSAALSIWLLLATLAVGVGALWLRRRFSLAALLLTVVIAAGVASVPKVLLEDKPLHTGYVVLSESIFTGGSFLDENELAKLETGLAPATIFARLPARLREDLKLTPGMLRSVRVEPSEARDPSHRNTLLKVDLREDLSAEQSATLFHAVSAQALELTKELYAPRMQKGIQGSSGGFLSHPNNTSSRFGEYEKEWASGAPK